MTMTIRTWKSGYGLWFAEVLTPRGAFTGGGHTEHWAIYRAKLKAQEAGRG